MKFLLTLCAFVGMMTAGVAQTVTLQLNLEEGATYSQNSSSDLVMSQDYGGEKIDIKIKVQSQVDFKVIAITDTGYDLEVEFDRISMTMEMPMVTMEFNSEKADGADIMSTILASMMHKPFGVTMTRRGEVTEMRNLSTLLDSTLEKYPQMTEEQKNQIRAQLANTFGENGLKGNIEMTTFIFPEGPVAISDTWSTQTQVDAEWSFAVKSIFRLEAIEAGHYVVSAKSEVSTLPAPDSAAIKYDLSGTSLYNLKLAKKSGWIQDGSVKQSMSGKIVFADSPEMPGGMEVPMSMESEVAVMDR
ncbi:MAG TPA: DUF6263 family protein [Cyclobacteriaceae bacterium]|nr:DUF6263 family protein [Cyclobacteriaceae bacterium]